MKFWKNVRSKVLFTDSYRPVARELRKVMEHYKAEGKRIAIWGGGLKGNAFLHAVDPKGQYVDEVIDISANDKGVVGGHSVISCYGLKEHKLDVIFMMSQKHYVTNHSILTDQGIHCILHDVDEITQRGLTEEQILANEDLVAENDEEKIAMTKRIQQDLLPILKEVKRVCEKLEIPYFLCAGSCLGAVRHQGFIPWDDDIDIGMLREDYERFLREARGELQYPFMLIDNMDVPHYYVNHAKVFKDNTASVNREVSHLKIHHGFYLDIFPFDKMSEKEEEQNRLYEDKTRMRGQIVAMRHPTAYSGKNPIKKWLANPGYYKAKFKSARKAFRDGDAILTRFRHTDTNLVADITAPYRKRLIYNLSDIVPYGEATFEGETYPVPGNTDAYLSVMYGDYMQLPPEDKRYVKHDIIFYSSEENYGPDEKWLKKTKLPHRAEK